MKPEVLVAAYLFVVLLLGVVIYLQVKMYRRSSRRDSVLIHKVIETEKNLLILGKVVKIFEDETQILKKRNEQAAVRDRFRGRQ
jgi:hypothetical protein